MVRVPSFAIWLGATIAVRALSAQAPFDQPFAVPDATHVLAVVDLRNDGFPDFVTGSPFATTFNPPTIHEMNGGPRPVSSTQLPMLGARFAAADFNGDGFEDLVCDAGCGIDALVLIAGGPLGTPLAAVFPPGACPTTFTLVSIASGDFDGDGDQDVARLQNGVLQVSWNLGAFVFSASQSFSSGSTFYSLEFGAADLDGDGDDEIIAGHSSGILIAEFTGTSGATMTTILPNVIGIQNLQILDVENDGDLDVAYGAADSTSYIGFILKSGGSWTPATPVGIPFGGPGSFADVDSDNDIDVVYLAFDGSVAVAINDGTYAFTPGPVLVPTPATAPINYGAFAGLPVWRDFDADGDIDLAYGRLSELIVLLSTTNGPNFDQIALVSGAAQFAPAGSAYATPIQWAVTSPAGAPRSNEAFVFESLYGNAMPFGGTTNTAGTGSAVAIARPQPGKDDRRVVTPRSHPNGLVVALESAASEVIIAVAGQNQSVLIGQPAPIPFEVLVLDSSTGLPRVAVPVLMSADGAGAFTPSWILTTNALGRASVSFTPTQTLGTRTITATTSISAVPAVFELSVGVPPGSIAVIAGSAQYGNVGETLAAPLVVRVLDPLGAPLANAPVAFATLPGFGTFSVPNATTDAFGFASTAFTMSSALGSRTITATYGTSSVTFQAYARGLGVQWIPAASALTLYFGNDHPQVPLLAAADLPMPSPGYVPTPFGRIYTSVLQPLPSLIALDGIGVLGPPDPTVVADPNWSRSFTVAPSSVAGLTLVFQIYGIDTALAFPTTYFTTNAVTLTL